MRGGPIEAGEAGGRAAAACYPEEVSGDAMVEAAIDAATQDVAAVRNDQEIRNCFIHGDFDELECPECLVRNDQEG